MNLISFTLGPPAASLKRLPEATLSLASVRDNGSENWMGCGVQGGFKDREAMCRGCCSEAVDTAWLSCGVSNRRVLPRN